MSDYYHGGAIPDDLLLTPQPHMRSGAPGDGWVYITPDQGLAAIYASTLPGGRVMRVLPIGPVERDPDSILGTSYRCRRALVVEARSLTPREKAARDVINAWMQGGDDE